MVLHVAVDVDVVERAFELLLEVVAELDAGARLRTAISWPADFAGFAEADDAGDVEGSGAHAALVASAVDLLGDLHARVAAADVERADALGAVDFVRGERERRRCCHGVHVDGDLAYGLDGVGVEEDALLVAELADFGDGLDDADLVVRDT